MYIHQKIIKLYAVIKNIFLFLKSVFLDFLSPTSCVVCGKGLIYLCSMHKKYLKKYPSECFMCHTPTPYGETCYDHKDSVLSGVIIGYYYTNLVKYFIHQAKYNGAYTLLQYLAEWLIYDILATPFLYNKLPVGQLIISYIPMYWNKETHERGNNQAKILAQAIAQILHVPCIGLCKKTKNTLSQASLSRKDRIANMKNVFVFDLDSPQCIGSSFEKHNTVTPDISSATILLVDDIFTTGSTIENCAIAIKKHYPCAQVWGLCIARHTI